MRLSDPQPHVWRLAECGLLPEGQKHTCPGNIGRIRRDDRIAAPLADGRRAGGAVVEPLAIEPGLSGAEQRTLAHDNAPAANGFPQRLPS